MSKPSHPGAVMMERCTRPVVVGAAKHWPPKRPKREVVKDSKFVPILIGRDTMKRLRKLQKAGRPRLNLKYLSDAGLQLALERVGGQTVRDRAQELAQSARQVRS